MKLFTIIEGMNAARELLGSKQNLLANFDSIYCGPCPPSIPNQRAHFENACRFVGTTLQIHFDPTLPVFSVEFRARDGLILAALYFRDKEKRFALVEGIPPLDLIEHIKKTNWITNDLR